MKVDLLEIDQRLKLREMIVKLRRHKGLTQEELAERVGAYPALISFTSKTV